jgi:hypothetical protein
MNTSVENIRIKKQLQARKSKSSAGKEVVSKQIKDKELIFLFQCADEVFKGWKFFENEIYEGVFTLDY